jgi:hypothetical protein
VSWIILLIGLELPATMAFLDCLNRSEEEFAAASDRAGWLRWLIVALVTSVIGVGCGIVLGYYWAVVKRTTPVRP